MQEADTAKLQMREVMKREKVKGFAEVIVAKNLADGISFLWVFEELGV